MRALPERRQRQREGDIDGDGSSNDGVDGEFVYKMTTTQFKYGTGE